MLLFMGSESDTTATEHHSPKEQRRRADQSPSGTGMPSGLVVQESSLPSRPKLQLNV